MKCSDMKGHLETLRQNANSVDNKWKLQIQLLEEIHVNYNKTLIEINHEAHKIKN